MVTHRSKILILWFFMTFVLAFSQEGQQSADISEEVNSDAFQEYFFDALQQKSIENYDKAIIALIECKKLRPDNEVVDYELGLSYMGQKNFIQAQDYLENAADKDPNNKWYQDALLRCLLSQHNYHAAVPVGEKLVMADVNYYKTLADIYIELGQQEEAKKIIDRMESEGVDLGAATRLKNKLLMRDRIQDISEEKESELDQSNQSVSSPIAQYQKQIEKQFEKTDFGEALHFSSEAIDNFPTQPLFYLYKARSLNKLQKYSMVPEILEEGLSYILDDDQMKNNFYKEFIVAYKALGNKEKESYYQGLIKN